MNSLRTIRTVHTVIWAILATCILLIPAFGLVGMYREAVWATGIVLLEIFILALNGWQCPLTALAARHTDDRRANFDIYIPEFLAAHNKLIFGVLFLIGEVIVVLRWLDAGLPE